MKRRLLQMLGAGLLGAAFWFGGEKATSAQDYWAPSSSVYVGPYRSYYSGPSYYYGGPSYYRSYSVQPHYSYGPSVAYRSYYAPSYGYGGAYYGLPRAGYYASPYGGGQVRVGRLGIGW